MQPNIGESCYLPSAAKNLAHLIVGGRVVGLKLDCPGFKSLAFAGIVVQRAVVSETRQSDSR